MFGQRVCLFCRKMDEWFIADVVNSITTHDLKKISLKFSMPIFFFLRGMLLAGKQIICFQV